jgi:N utilization substance protein B
LYAHASDNELGAATLLKNLDKSLEEVHDLFLWDIHALLRIYRTAVEQLEKVQSRNVPDTALEDKISVFTSIPFFELVATDDRLIAFSEGVHVDWSNYDNHFRNLWKDIFEGEEFEKLLATPTNFAAQKRFVKYIYQIHIAENELLHDIYEDMHVGWSDDLDAAQMMSGKVISSWNEQGNIIIPHLYKDEGDAAFGALLMRKYFEFASDSEARIKSKSKNWESDRIAKLDVVLMKLCIAEWRGMDEIPVKVSMNEYLDLAKEYSTPKSSSFINGILDKIVTNLREEGQLNKVGRGIIE